MAETVGPAQTLAELLETLPTPKRQEVTAWLLQALPARADRSWAAVSGSAGQLSEPALRLARLGSSISVGLGAPLVSGQDSQLVTLRLPADRHAALRVWCTEHGFTMAAVLRGLVERFLDEQTRTAALPPAE